MHRFSRLKYHLKIVLFHFDPSIDPSHYLFTTAGTSLTFLASLTSPKLHNPITIHTNPGMCEMIGTFPSIIIAKSEEAKGGAIARAIEEHDCWRPKREPS